MRDFTKLTLPQLDITCNVMPVVTTALAGAASLIACAFTLSSMDRWLRRRAPHELAWTVAMALFAVASLGLWWAESTGWTMLVFRVFFLVRRGAQRRLA